MQAGRFCGLHGELWDMDGLQTEERSLREIESRAIGVGAVGGVLAGMVMGLLFQVGTGLMPVLGALAGEASILRGWIVHLTVSTLYGVLFAFLVAYPPIRSFLGDFEVDDFAFAGVVYAVVMAAATVSLLPFVFELPWVTDASTAPFPGVPGPGLLGLIPAAIFGIAHLVYGAILGAVYGIMADTPD